MEVASPPKRMTRARAAAAATTGPTKPPATTTTKATARVTTTKKTKAGKSADATAQPTTTSTTRTSTKRKARSDEAEDEDPLMGDPGRQNTMNKPARTRAKARKLDTPEPEPALATEPADPAPAVPKATRGRPRKTPATTAAKPEPAKATRTRTRKAATGVDDADAPAEPVKKTARGRAASNAKATAGTVTTTVGTEPTPGLKSNISRPTSRIGGVVRKTVTFQEPEKENLVPANAGKAKNKTTEPSATGMRAKPVRKPATAGRTTRASARAATTGEKKEKTPLSPKKGGQNRPVYRDASSDDELAGYDETPLKPLMRSPVKPPGGARKFELPPAAEEEDHTQQTSTGLGPSVLGSPARRPPSSPFKDAMKSPAKRVDAVPSLVLPSSTGTASQATQSPHKASMLQSPAKRPQLPITTLQPASHDQPSASRSPLKMSLFGSPAKRPMSPFKVLGSSIPPAEKSPAEPVNEESPANGLSPAEEPQPVSAVADAGAATEAESTAETGPTETGDENVQLESPVELAFPGRLSAVLPRHADPALQDSPLRITQSAVEEAIMPEPTIPEATVPEPTLPESPASEADVPFPATNEDFTEEHHEEICDDPMDVDDVTEEEQAASSPTQATPPRSPPKKALHPIFGLRAKDLDDQYISESEDELAASGRKSFAQDDSTLTFSGPPATPTPANVKNRGIMPTSAAKAANRAIRSVSRGSKLGFTPLAMQLSEWKASSPLKLGKAEPTPLLATATEEEQDYSLLAVKESPAADPSPSKGYFDDEMKIRLDMENQAAMEAALEADIAARFDDTELEPEFDDVAITNEDRELVEEADEMSHLEQDQVDQMIDTAAHGDANSEASQEYGDENAVPIDPALLTGNMSGIGRNLDPATPMRAQVTRTFHTTSKVPLKAGDDSPPRSIKRRCASVSKPPVQRPNSHSRNATVHSFSPIKNSGTFTMDMDTSSDEEEEEEAGEAKQPPVTPEKSDIWSSMGSPARTPRRDLNPSLLRGAVVFVDVYTSEGADASTVFVELLTQMGARCVKGWSWNPSTLTDGEASTSKVGITHVVYKDGGKRTMEKVRESNGVVQCVGVGWVLDCERQNEWLDEAPYYIDTSLVPRGGRNRRKSMEPKALANLNGTLVTPMKNNPGPARECQTAPNHHHMSRRDSTAWVRTPSDKDEDEDAPHEPADWESDMGGFLTPVPKTPAPEALHRFAMETPTSGYTSADASEEEEQEQLLMRTCPPKQQQQGAFTDLGDGVLGRRGEKDENNVMMRLMAARRKSLQFAPKIASPLSRAWN
ncbi:hypothetical protein GGR56DRAFT_649837 [Xylariaceae sp. FL0804]|nr:hypothetical protein GGR56DRAFT_649837 [Xylariaceae sp. FL0804]